MGQDAKAPRENRTITVDLQDESTYFQLRSRACGLRTIMMDPSRPV